MNAERAQGRAVLRLSPPGVAIRGPADVGLQGRVMGALAAAGLPAPSVLAAASEPVVAGRAFALMTHVDADGWSGFAARRGHDQTARAAVAALQRIQTLPVGHPVLAELPALEPLAELRRWRRLLDRAPAGLRVPALLLHDNLGLTAPATTGPQVLVHGDFHYGNLLFDPDGDGGVVAVIDWEIASIGHPLTDLACLGVASLRRRYQPDPNPPGDVEIALADLVAIAGADPAEAAWFLAASCFKYATIIGYNLELHRSGRRVDPVYEQLQATMHHLVVDGQRMLVTGLEGL
jgi:aminoglycoside phosphotransferase (APT) family kinase protein